MDTPEATATATAQPAEGSRSRSTDIREKLTEFRCEEGLSTVEYAVGTVAVAALGGLLVKLLGGEFVANKLQAVFDAAFSSVLG